MIRPRKKTTKKRNSRILIESDNDKRTYRSGWEWQRVGGWDTSEEVKTMK